MPDKHTPSLAEMVRMRVVWQVPGMDEVNVRCDIVYKMDGDQPLHMDLYQPAVVEVPRAAVILIHGGPVPRLGAKNMGVFVSYGELLAASGLAGVTFNHRFLAPDRIEDAEADVSDLIGHVRTNAGELGIDPDRLALWAFSGGGPFLAGPLRHRPSWLRALVAYYAVLDLQELPPGDAGNVSLELRQAFSPLCALGETARSAPPMLIARAGLDHPWLNGGIDRFVLAALSRGGTLDLLNHPEGRHGFDILDDDARSREIIRRTLGFLTDHLAQ